MKMDHPEEDIIVNYNKDKIMMLSMKRKLILKKCGYKAERVDLWKDYKHSRIMRNHIFNDEKRRNLHLRMIGYSQKPRLIVIHSRKQLKTEIT